MEPSTRDLLIEDVRQGRKAPAEAEAEAARLCIGPLARTPNPIDFDPMKEAWWSLPMTIAWILWRSKDQVRDHWDKYRLECWDWHFRRWRVGFDGEVHEGSFLDQRPPATLSDLMLADAYDAVWAGPCRYARTALEAKESLWDALARGIVSASAVEDRSHTRVRVGCGEWIDLEPHEERGIDVVRPRLESAAAGPTYQDLRIERSAAVEYWSPAVPGESGYAGPALTTPTGEGYMPLSCAAQWIASYGNSIDPNAFSDEDWLSAYQQLTAAIASENTKIIGIHDGEMQPLPGYKFAGCRINLLWAPELDGTSDTNEMYLRACYFTTHEEWEDRFNDALVKRRDKQWTKIMIAKADVAERWPFYLGKAEPAGDAEEAPQPPPIMRTGAPGRPTSMHLVEKEHSRRLETGEAIHGVKEESRDLADWLHRNYPDAPQLKPKSIENNIRAVHRLRQAQPRN